MPVMDEFKEEREALKQGSLKQKFQYFLDYYKWHAIGAVIIIYCAVLLIHHYATYKETALYAALLNSSAINSVEDYTSSFMEYADISPADYMVTFEYSLSITFDPSSSDVYNPQFYSSKEKLDVLMTAEQLDAIVCNDELFGSFANSGIFCDLRSYLSQEQIRAYEPYFYYVDEPLVEQISQAQLNMDSSFQPQLPDPTKPELMEDPVPVGIYVQDNEALSETFYIRGDGPVVAGIISNAPHPDMAAKYLEYLRN